jgi:hypothetical protein
MNPRRAFSRVARIGRTLPGVLVVTRYNGLPGLQVHGVFLASLAATDTAEPNSLVVRCDPDERALLLEEASDTYYVTDDHHRYPVVLVRLSTIDDAALRDVLAMSWRLTAAKTPKGRRRPSVHP